MYNKTRFPTLEPNKLFRLFYASTSLIRNCLALKGSKERKMNIILCLVFSSITFFTGLLLFLVSISKFNVNWLRPDKLDHFTKDGRVDTSTILADPKIVAIVDADSFLKLKMRLKNGGRPRPGVHISNLKRAKKFLLSHQRAKI